MTASRRTVVRGALWALPAAILAGTVKPSFAAIDAAILKVSTCECGDATKFTLTFQPEPPSLAVEYVEVDNIRYIPTSVTQVTDLTYEVSVAATGLPRGWAYIAYTSGAGHLTGFEIKHVSACRKGVC